MMHRLESSFIEFSEMLQRRYPEDEWLQKEFQRLWHMAREYEPLLHAYEHVKSRSGYVRVPVRPVETTPQIESNKRGRKPR
jgi:hypothetical protein